jgi:hypothetical protein
MTAPYIATEVETICSFVILANLTTTSIMAHINEKEALFNEINDSDLFI